MALKGGASTLQHTTHHPTASTMGPHSPKLPDLGSLARIGEERESGAYTLSCLSNLLLGKEALELSVKHHIL